MINFVWRWWRRIALVLSSEWILTHSSIPNGGAVILLRTVISATLIFILVHAVINLVDPSRTWELSLTELRLQLVDHFGWFGVIFAGIYTALYARFSSQWTYLASLYNRIKEVEITSGSVDHVKLADWKGAFLEDAEDLHLVTKQTFVTVAKAWADDQAVRERYIRNTPGGNMRFEQLVKKLETAIGIANGNFGQA